MKLVHYLEECNEGCNDNASLGYGSPDKSSNIDGKIETEGTLVSNGTQETKYGLRRQVKISTFILLGFKMLFHIIVAPVTVLLKTVIVTIFTAICCHLRSHKM